MVRKADNDNDTTPYAAYRSLVRVPGEFSERVYLRRGSARELIAEFRDARDSMDFADLKNQQSRTVTI